MKRSHGGAETFALPAELLGRRPPAGHPIPDATHSAEIGESAVHGAVCACEQTEPQSVRQSGADLAAGLRERAVLVRHFNKPRIQDFLRITVGTEDQCGRLIEALRDLV